MTSREGRTDHCSWREAGHSSPDPGEPSDVFGGLSKRLKGLRVGKKAPGRKAARSQNHVCRKHGFAAGPLQVKGTGGMPSVCCLCPREPRQEETAFKEGWVTVTVSWGMGHPREMPGRGGKAKSSLPSDFKSLGVCPPTTPLWHPSSKALPNGARALFL